MGIFDQLFNASNNDPDNGPPIDDGRPPQDKGKAKEHYRKEAEEVTKEGNGGEQPRDGKIW